MKSSHVFEPGANWPSVKKWKQKWKDASNYSALPHRICTIRPWNILHKINLGGDHLTVERAVSAVNAVADSGEAHERLEGLILKHEEFHCEMNFLQVCFDQWFVVFPYTCTSISLSGKLITGTTRILTSAGVKKRIWWYRLLWYVNNIQRV